MALVGNLLRKGRQAVGQTVENIGNRLGIPETGISERIAGRPTPSSVGKAGAAYTPAPSLPKPTGGGIGALIPYQQSVMGGTGGGTGGGGGVAPQQQFSAPPMESVPGAPAIDFDAMIAPALAGLDQAAGSLESGYQSTVSDINAKKGTALEQQNLATQGQEKVLSSTRTGQEQNAESAVNEARRQLSEIQQGLQARYGGTTGTGAFATEIAGSTAIGQIGKVRENLSNSLKAIDDKLFQVKELGKIALKEIEDDATAQVNDAKRQLDANLADIRNRKGELQMRKAEMAYQAVQNYQNLVAEIGARNTQFQQDLYTQQQAAEQKLAEKRAQGQSLANSISVKDLGQLIGGIQPIQGLSISGKAGVNNGQIGFTPSSFSFKSESEDEDIENPFE